VADFLAWLELGGASPRTLDQYERDLARGALMFPDKALTDLTDGDLSHIARRFKPRERRVRVAAWRSFFKWAKRTRRTTFDPTEALPDLRVAKQRVIDVFSDAEVDALLSLDVADAAPLAVLLEAGLRKAEARALRFRHCHPESGQVIVLQGKGSRDRIVPMSSRLSSLLSHLALFEALDEREHIFYSVRANDVVSRRQRAHPVGEGTFARWWRRCLDDAGVRYRTPHTARHTFATRWRLRGLAVDEIQILLGHSSIRTTSDLYVHTQVQDVAEHMALIEATEAP
jgi:integrase/recombinase XerD